MNNARRKEIEKIVKALEDIDVESHSEQLESVRDEEQEAFNNMPESLQQGERGQASEAAIEALQEAFDALEQARDSLQEAIDALGRAGE
ncbi:hypothetical protein RCMCDREAMY_89 [Rhodobacter phage RcMcDreamy]|nr:hypothetical protein RCMCDREAMY_89 [Rhodobacter phage RcMcDreamy]